MSSSLPASRAGLPVDSSPSGTLAARARPAALQPRSAAPQSPGYLADVPIFQRVQAECGALGLSECVRRFRAQYKGRERYSDEALQMQFLDLGVRGASTPAGVAARQADEQSRADACELRARRGSQQAERQAAVLLDDSDSDQDHEDDGFSQDEPVDDAGLSYRPSSPVAASQPAPSVQSSTPQPAALASALAVIARVMDGKYDDDDDDDCAAGRVPETAGAPSDTGADAAGVATDPALVEAVAAALAARRARGAAAKRRRQDEERRAASQRWKMQCRDCAGAVGRTVYRGVTAMACGYGLAQAIATVFPSEVEQAATFTQQQLTTLIGHL